MAIADWIATHQYSEAAANLKRQLKRQPKNAGVHAELAEVMLCMGKNDAALEHFKIAHTNNKDGDIGSFPYYDWLGIAYWLVEDKASAINILSEAVERAEKGIIRMGDLAGGASHGLLLWYIGVTARHKTAIDRAKRYLLKLVSRKKTSYISDFDMWPRPLALMAIGKMTADQVLDGLTKDIEKTAKDEVAGYGAHVNESARCDASLPMREYFAQTLFYIGAFHRDGGRRQQSRKFYFLSSCIENPVSLPEWYLARSEIGWLKRNDRKFTQSI